MTDGLEPMAMFPLGTVLLPQAHLPLRVFEPRYVQMIHDIGPAGGVFGVVLIERGPEVGGGEIRTSVGCRAEIISTGVAPSGELLLTARGTHRVTVVDWLADAPYPRAMVRDLTDPAATGDPVHGQLLDAFLRLVGLVAAGEEPTSEAMELGDDPVERGYRIADLLPLNPLDAFGALAAETPEERAVLLLDAIDGIDAVVRSDLGR